MRTDISPTIEGDHLRPGAVLQGRYRIVSSLGAGGFGIVYKAIQLATSQPVAVKVLRSVYGEPADRRDNRVARFRREMELCARLQHPNIVGLIDSGQTDEGQLFAVFQFASGSSLDQVLLDEGPLQPREARHLMLQVLDALSCAHHLRVVHRDLKPANIMIVATGTRRNALVLDFGIGTIAQDLHETSSAKLTAQHEWVGTPYYAAPEQIRGYPPTAQSDIYSWGLVYLECLTGRPVISGSPTVALMLHVAPDAIPIPPSVREHALGRILRQAVVKDVAERTATAASLLVELDNCDVSDLVRLARDDTAPRVVGRGVLTGPTVTSGVDLSEGPSDRPGPPALAASTPGAAASVRDRLVDREQRQITAVCCALAPSCGLELDELDAQIQRLHEICAAVAERFAGQLAGGLGHQVLIEFGVPIAGEDDALRAARAALAVRAAVAERNASAGGGRRMEIRIGMHTGLIAYGRHDPARISSQVFSMTPMIASQLSAIAERDTIVASAAAAQALRTHLAMTRLGRHVLDGDRAGIELYRIEAVRAGARAKDPAGDEQLLALVGRERELALLAERWREVASGTGHSVLISGEAGIGKSRLTTELGRQVRAQPHVWLEARCTLETRNRVLHPMLEVLEVVLDLNEVAPDGRLDRIEAAMIDFGFRPGEVVPLVAELLSVGISDRYPTVELSPARRGELTRNVIVSLLLELAERVPVVLFVEDLHWADPTTLDLLDALVAAIPSSRVLAVLSARPEFTPPWRSSATDHLQLGRLARAPVEQMIRIVAGGKALPAAVVDQLIARTDGVPLFVEELTRMVLESGALTAQGDRYELTGALSDVAIPTTLRGSLMARLDRLGRAKTTAQLAAALGREFDLALLRAVGELDDAAIKDDLDRLAEADLVHHRRRLRNPTWLFRHGLIRDIAYESMPRGVQHKVHARIASVIEQQFPELAAARPDLLALHHAAADHKARAIGYARKAARSALLVSAYAQVIRQARDAIGWLDQVPDPRRSDADPPEPLDEIDRIAAELDLRITLGVPLMMTEGFASPEVQANSLRVLALCERAGDHAAAQQFPALWGLWTVRQVGGDHAGAEAAAARLTALGARTGDSGIQLAALTAHGTAVMMRGRLAEARDAFEAALAIYDPRAHGDLGMLFGQDAGAMCAAFLTWVHGHAGDAARAEVCALAALARCDALGQPSTRAFVETVLATWRCLRGDYAQAERHSSVVIRLAADQGMTHWDAQAQITRGWAIAGLGQPGEGAAIARGGIDALIRIGSRAAMTFYWGGLAQAELLAGRCDRAMAAIEQASRYMTESDERIHEAGLALIEAQIAFADGDRDRAGAAIARALVIGSTQGAGELVRRAHELQGQLAGA